ncbi:hypothetical protein OnM2_035009 [Erysiphe neolycopersici]|uniref:Uncharacterized protein n=1 Tax=Erysiphe neolycopersici TaxID=212602 RepID=A0A420HXS9_9PEZI|nr:hypothetical protein OnM2_035009 [Erysiphe neolycopersici]
MTNSLDLSTPPPLTIRTPNTPQFGFRDNYKSYSPRRSARLAQRHLLFQKTATPSYHDFHSNHTPSQRPVDQVTSSNIAYPTPSQKLSGKYITRDLGSNTSRKKQEVTSSYENSTDTTRSFDITTTNETTESIRQISSTVHKNGMLPTPAKTPVKRPLKPSSSITSIARNLFPAQSSKFNELVMTPRRKGNTKIKSDRIEVFTDPHDRIPEKDSCPNNPFHVDSSSNLSQLQRQAKKRRKVIVPGEGVQSVEELQRRNDGLLYVFRGKKIWRKFSDDSEDDNVETTDNEMDDCETNLHKPLTRSSVKPRLLFSRSQLTRPHEANSHNFEDEEADTDIEDSVLCSQSFRTEEVTTPKTTKFAPASPPTTIRATRSKKLDLQVFPNSKIDYVEAGTSCYISRDIRENSPSYTYNSKLRSTGASRKRDGEHFIGPGKKIKLR